MRTSCCTSSGGWESIHHTDTVVKDALTETTLVDYVRFQSGQECELTGATINERVAIVDRALRVTFPDAPSRLLRPYRRPTGNGHQWASANHVPP